MKFVPVDFNDLLDLTHEVHLDSRLVRIESRAMAEPVGFEVGLEFAIDAV